MSVVGHNRYIHLLVHFLHSHHGYDHAYWMCINVSPSTAPWHIAWYIY